MTAQQISTGTRFVWNQQKFEVRRRLPNSKVNIVNLETGEATTISVIDLFNELIDNRLSFLNQEDKPLVQAPVISWDDIPEKYRLIAKYRLEVIAPLLDIPRNNRKPFVQQHVKEHKKKLIGQTKTGLCSISESSVYRWLRAYEQSGRDIRSLLPRYEKRGHKGKVRISKSTNKIVEAAVDDLIYLEEKRSLDYVHREIAVRVAEENLHRLPSDKLLAPSRATVARRIRDRDIDGILVAKRGKQEAEKELRQIGSMNYPNFPLERVEMDHTLTDLIVVDENDYLPLGRLCLTYCLDVFTRYPLGYFLSFEPASYLSIMECLYHAILPKSNVREVYETKHDWQAFGIPYTLVVDRGPEFVGNDLKDACMLLEINLEYMPPKTPEYKESVERLFGTINTGLLHTSGGTTFSNLWERGDYNSLKKAIVTLEDLEKMLVIHNVDIYAESFHTGLKAVPARQWETLTSNGFFPRVPSSNEELRVLLGRSEQRTVQKYGIELYNLRYNRKELGPLRTLMKKNNVKNVKIKYHPGDLSRIYVFNPFERQYVEVPALAQSYTQGLSLWKHQIILSYARKHSDKVDIVALGMAQRKIQQIVEESMNASKSKIKSRSREARYINAGRAPSLENKHQDHNREPVQSKQNDSSANTLDAISSHTKHADEFIFDTEKLTHAGWGFVESAAIEHDNSALESDKTSKDEG